ncbi:hypothetical protein M8494_27100 [Serratia ureilytica]
MYLAPLASRAYAALFEQKSSSHPTGIRRPNASVSVSDGRAKVMGRRCSRATSARWTCRTGRRNRRTPSFFASLKPTGCSRGVDLSLLGDDLQPDRLVTAEIWRATAWPSRRSHGDDMLLPSGKTPAYLGQAVAILIYHDFARFRFAKDKLKFREEAIKYGAVTGPLGLVHLGQLPLCAGGGRSAVRRRSLLQPTEGHADLPGVDEKHLPVWPGRARGRQKLDREGMRYVGLIADEMANPPADWLVMSRRYTTQVDRHLGAGPDNAARLVRRRDINAASGGADPVAAGSGRRDAAHAGQASTGETADPAPVLHRGLRLRRSLQLPVLRRGGGDVRRHATRCAGQRPLRAAVPDGAEARTRST